MPPRTLDDQLTKYLTDLHAIEQQALTQMRLAPRLAGDPEIAQAFSAHLAETEDHERLVRERLAGRGAAAAKVKDVVGSLTGLGFAAFAAGQPDTPGKLVAHAYSYEHMEEAGHRVVAMLASRAGDTETTATLEGIEAQERAMGERLAGLFDQAATAALRELDPSSLREQLAKYLADAHAIEAQATQLLGKGPHLAGDEELASAYAEHLEETEEHTRVLEERLEALEASPSALKDAGLRAGALNWGAFFGAQPDTPVKLAAFAYALEHLEIAGYELLTRVARRVGDEATIAAAQRILAQERAAAERIHSLLGQALDASLHAQDLPVR